VKSFFRSANLGRFDGQTVQPRQLLRLQQMRPRRLQWTTGNGETLKGQAMVSANCSELRK
jgi:hypothetical protein